MDEVWFALLAKIHFDYISSSSSNIDKKSRKIEYILNLILK